MKYLALIIVFCFCQSSFAKKAFNPKDFSPEGPSAASEQKVDDANFDLEKIQKQLKDTDPARKVTVECDGYQASGDAIDNKVMKNCMAKRNFQDSNYPASVGPHQMGRASNPDVTYSRSYKISD